MEDISNNLKINQFYFMKEYDPIHKKENNLNIGKNI
uniref:Uncharacterized protein n=1 Tax=viral metagenome TaxID=1070528 RepID=A0A6C0BEA5_9ZZZZ